MASQRNDDCWYGDDFGPILLVVPDLVRIPTVPSASGMTKGSEPTLSVVAPLYNESQNVRPLVEWILQALEAYPGTFEIILVDDGSRDSTWDEVRLATADQRVHGLRLGANVGQTAAM